MPYRSSAVVLFAHALVLATAACLSAIAALSLPSSAVAGAVSNSCDAGVVDKTWEGDVSTNWATAGNWAPSGAPAPTSDVCIPAATPFAPVVSKPARRCANAAASRARSRSTSPPASCASRPPTRRRRCFTTTSTSTRGAILENLNSLTIEGDLEWSAATIQGAGRPRSPPPGRPRRRSRTRSASSIPRRFASTAPAPSPVTDPDVNNDDTYLSNGAEIAIGSGGSARPAGRPGHHRQRYVGAGKPRSRRVRRHPEPEHRQHPGLHHHSTRQRRYGQCRRGGRQPPRRQRHGDLDRAVQRRDRRHERLHQRHPRHQRRDGHRRRHGARSAAAPPDHSRCALGGRGDARSGSQRDPRQHRHGDGQRHPRVGPTLDHHRRRHDDDRLRRSADRNRRQHRRVLDAQTLRIDGTRDPRRRDRRRRLRHLHGPGRRPRGPLGRHARPPGQPEHLPQRRRRADPRGTCSPAAT